MNHKNIYIAILVLAFSLAGCGNFFSKDRERVGMPDDLRQKMQTQLTEGEEKLATAKDEATKKDALLQIAFSSEQLGKLDLAISRYQDALATDPDNFQALNNLGVIYEELKDYRKSASYYQKILETAPSNTEALEDSIRVLIFTEDIASARKTLETFSASYNKQGEMKNPDTERIIASQQKKIDEAQSDIIAK